MSPPDSRISLLIQVSGQDRVGLTHALTRILTRHQVPHARYRPPGSHPDSIALGMLVEASDSNCQSLKTELAAAATDWEVRLQATVVEPSEYAPLGSAPNSNSAISSPCSDARFPRPKSPPSVKSSPATA